jgi:hypothetical protein
MRKKDSERLKRVKVALIGWNEKKTSVNEAVYQIWKALMEPYSNKPIDRLLNQQEGRP